MSKRSKKLPEVSGPSTPPTAAGGATIVSPSCSPNPSDRSPWTTGVAVAAVIASFGSLTAAIFALISTYEFRRELAYPEQASHIADLFVGIYLDRQFPTPVVADGKTCTTLKQARELIRGRLRGKPLDEQKRLLEEFREATLKSDSWENAFAYELTLAQERVGAMVFTGVLPLETILAVNGYGILEDWAYSSRLTESRIRQPEDPVSVKGSVPFQRRHAEWLACVASLYVSKHWRSQKQDLFIGYVGTRASILEKETNLRQLEGFLLSSRTARSVDALREQE